MTKYNSLEQSNIREAMEEALLRIPAHMKDGVRNYIDQGIKPGGFLTAVLANDFYHAVLRADSINVNHLKAWALLLDHVLPRPSYGSYQAVSEWCVHGGLSGKRSP